MTAQTFRTKPVEVQAIQWTGTNAQAVIDFAGARFGVIDEENRDSHGATAELWLDGSGRYVPLVEGDWVVRTGMGWLIVVEAKDFASSYSAVTPEVVA